MIPEARAKDSSLIETRPKSASPPLTRNAPTAMEQRKHIANPSRQARNLKPQKGVKAPKTRSIEVFFSFPFDYIILRRVS
jgi:hypothetical protein